MDDVTKVQVFVLTIVIISTILLVVLVLALAWLARTSRFSAMRIGAAATGLLLLVLSPVLVDTAVTQFSPARGMKSYIIDIGLPLAATPAAIAVVVLALSAALRHRKFRRA